MATRKHFVVGLDLNLKSRRPSSFRCIHNSSSFTSHWTLQRIPAQGYPVKKSTCIGTAVAAVGTLSIATLTFQSNRNQVKTCCQCQDVVGSRDISQVYNHPSLTFSRRNDIPVTLASSPTPLIHTIAPSSERDAGKPINIFRRIKRWTSFKFICAKVKGSPFVQRINQVFFVVARGFEIIFRFSPLLVLTPTAILVTSINSWNSKFLFRPQNDDSSCLPRFSSEDDDIYLTQFLDEHQRHIFWQHGHGYNWASNLAWRYTLHTLQSLGPAFVKLGQWAATRRDLFPTHICNRLSDLHDMARTHDWQHTHETLVEAFGEDYERRGLVVRGSKNEGFASNKKINPKWKQHGRTNGILGSGSAAQVHRGTLTYVVNDDNNNSHKKTKAVAIKVLHPNIEQLVEQDLLLMQYTAEFIDRLLPLEVIKMLSLPRAVGNFSDVMRKQVDLRIEGNNLRVFRDNFGLCDDDDNEVGYHQSWFKRQRLRNRSPPSIEFPRPENSWISHSVLVEDYAGDDAVPISKYLSDNSLAGLKTRRKLAGPLIRAFFKMVFLDNFIHSDLHPGNVLVRRVTNGETNTEQFSIIFLDAGIATSLSSNDLQNLRDLFRAVVLNDGYTAGSLMVERARYQRCSSIPGGKHAFASGVSDIVSEFHDRRKQGLTLGAVRIGALLGRVLDLCRRYGVEIDPAMSSVVVSMLVLEGLGRSLDPDLNLIQAAIPFLVGRGRV